jgi:AraC family transcriptional regulator
VVGNGASPRTYDGTVSRRRTERLYDGPVVGLFDVVCGAAASGPADEEHATTTEVIIPLRGCFEVHRGRGRTVADAASAIVLRVGDDYRVGHPVGGGDECFVFTLPVGIDEEVVGMAGGPAGVVETAVRMRIHRARAALRRAPIDPVEAEEWALGVLDRVVRGASRPDGAGRTSHPLIERTRALLATRPGDRWNLDAIARQVFVSPAHLARRFRAVTGESIARYLLRLRLGLALDRLAGGERDLAALAADLGFSSHSHFTARFRATFGVTPSAFRRSLDPDRLAELRTIVTAHGRSAS